ncbi:Uncharacterised protein [Acinetobacter baumannii]|nr:Uncharacterised protein [Acinetobacter baumannii]
MADFFFNYYLMPFHLSVVALILLSVVETIGMYVGLRPSQLLKKIAPIWLTNSPLLNVKFSKALIFVFYSSISVLPVIFYSFLSLLYSITLSLRFT